MANEANSLDDGVVVQKDLVDEIKESPSGSSQETWREHLDRRLLTGQDAFVLLLKDDAGLLTASPRRRATLRLAFQ